MKLILLLVLTSCAHNTKESAKELINKKLGFDLNLLLKESKILKEMKLQTRLDQF